MRRATTRARGRAVPPVPEPEGAHGLDKWGVFDTSGAGAYGFGLMVPGTTEEVVREPVDPSRLISDDPISFNPLMAGSWASKQVQFPSIEVSDYSSSGQDKYQSHGNLDLTTTGYPRSYSTSDSSVSSVVSGTGTNLSTFSPVHTNFDGASSADGSTIVPSNWSRGPSPSTLVGPVLAQQPADNEEYLCLGPSCNAKFSTEDELKEHVRSVHALRGFTCDWASCSSTTFRTRDGLNWHVKAAHLLICPVPGCSQASFQSSKILDSHIRVAHPKEEHPDGAILLPAKPATFGPEPAQQALTAPSMQLNRTPTPRGVKRKADSADKAIKMTLSVAVAKKRCREQLRNVLEKRAKRSARPFQGNFAPSPRSVDSPPGLVRTRTPKLAEAASFPLVWEHGVLPFLVEFIPKWCGSGHVISVTRGRTSDSRRICIMTKKQVSRARKLVIAAHVRDLLPTMYRNSASFSFSIGQIDRLTWARGLSREMPDDICAARNPFYYTSPCMGDSIGTFDEETGDSTSTLGPCLLVGGGSYWLANFHPFLDIHQTNEAINVEHPSPADRSLCTDEGHDALCNPELDFQIGELTATSGLDLKTTRLSHDPYWEDMDKDAPLVVTDWTLISARTRQANMLRKFPNTTPRLMRDVPVTNTSSVQPGSSVISTGRSSGHQRGQVCEIPAYVSGDAGGGNGTGRATREWFIEEPEPYDNEEEWIRGGIGIEGDSGAAIIDADTNALLGTLWGRNKYFGSGPRHTFFTPISDVFDDIQEKCGQQGRPQLPQYRDEGERYAVYPVCRTCFDLRTYLESRRSSRESLRSMLGRNESLIQVESDHDLTSIEAISELATPKDQGYWLRHTGVEEAGMSFMNIVSPRPTTSFSFGYDSQGGASPRVTDMRSPYAANLNTEDLYDAEYGNPDVTTGKRPALPMVRTSSQGQHKRQRFGRPEERPGANFIPADLTHGRNDTQPRRGRPWEP